MARQRKPVAVRGAVAAAGGPGNPVSRPTSNPNPLGPEHLDALNRLLRECATTRKLCEQCEECGIDVDQEARQNAEQEAMASGIKRLFFPHAT